MNGIQSEQGLFDAAIESARIFNRVASECAVSGGLLRVLQQFSTPDEVMTKMHFHATKGESLQALLDVLVDTGLVERRQANGQLVYRALLESIAQNRGLDGGLQRYQPRYDVLEPWFGERHVDLIRSANRHLLGEDLAFFRSPSVKIRFDRTFLSAWRTNLKNPLYEFGRMVAVREMVRHCRRFLDLGSGLGYGAQRLAEFSPSGCEIVCVDRAPDMLAEARLLVYPGAKVRFIQWDLNNGLPLLPKRWFDGIMFNGAFHFIKNKETLLREMRQAMRPGGLLVIGHCFCRSSFPDEPMHSFYFSLMEDPSWPITFEELRSIVADAGFHEIHKYHRGSHSYILAELRPEDECRSSSPEGQ